MTTEQLHPLWKARRFGWKLWMKQVISTLSWQLLFQAAVYNGQEWIFRNMKKWPLSRPSCTQTTTGPWPVENEGGSKGNHFQGSPSSHSQLLPKRCFFAPKAQDPWLELVFSFQKNCSQQYWHIYQDIILLWEKIRPKQKNIITSETLS